MGEKVRLLRRVIFRIGLAVFLALSIFAVLAMGPIKEPPPIQRDWNQKGDPGLGDIIRLRVIAASDLALDQMLKLRVRDAVLELLRPELQDAASEDDAARVIREHLDQIRDVAEKTIEAQGFTAPVHVIWGVADFPVKAYGPVVFPAGNYQALKIVIGEGKGKNWWCVLFPPLCYVDLTRTDRGLAEDGFGLTPDSRTRVQKGDREQTPVLTTKIGELLDGSRSDSLLSWLWLRPV